jgi:DNA-binding IclR family transcriptional regulator
VVRRRVSSQELRLLLALTNNVRDGMPVALYTERTGVDRPAFRRALRQILANGLAEQRGDVYFLTEDGLDVVGERIDWLREHFREIREGADQR